MEIVAIGFTCICGLAMGFLALDWAMRKLLNTGIYACKTI